MLSTIVFGLALFMSACAIASYITVLISVALTKLDQSLLAPYFAMFIASVLWAWFYYLTH